MSGFSIFNHSVVRLRTTGRRTGRQYEVELWFVAKDHSVYFLAHKDSNWWRNIQTNPTVELYFDNLVYEGQGSIVNELRDEVFEMFRKKYGKSEVDSWYGGGKRGERVVVEVKVRVD